MPEESTDLPPVSVNPVGPAEGRSFEIGVWDVDPETSPYMRFMTLTTDQAREAFYALLEALVDDGKLPELSQVGPDLLVQGGTKKRKSRAKSASTPEPEPFPRGNGCTCEECEAGHA